MWASGIQASGISNASLWVNRGSPTSFDFDKGDLSLDGDWHDLDLSAIVAEGATFVQLQISTTNNVVGKYIIFKEKDFSDSFGTFISYIHEALYPHPHRIWLGLNEDRVVEYNAQPVLWSTIDISVAAWVMPGT